MDSRLTSSNDIRFVSNEMAGVMYSQQYSYKIPVFDSPFLMDIDLAALKQNAKEKFNPSYVFFDSNYYFLKADLNCQIFQEGDNYFVDCPMFKIKVWGKSKVEAINAFNFSFHSLVENFANEDNAKLSPSARRLKNKLQAIVA